MKDGMFGARYEVLRRAWYDGPYGGVRGRDRVRGCEVLIGYPYVRDDDRVADFVRKFELRSRVRHANLIPIYDRGAVDGLPFYTAPYLEVTPLRALASDRHAPEISLVEVVRGLVAVSNAVLLLEKEGLRRLALDSYSMLVTRTSRESFLHVPHSGWILDSAPRDDLAGTFICSPGYMSPEAARGAAEASHVYGLAGLLFLVLYGGPPNAGRSIPETFQALAARQGVPAPGSLTERAAKEPALAQRLEPVCLRSLDSNPSRRHPDVAAFTRDLQAALAGC